MLALQPALMVTVMRQLFLLSANAAVSQFERLLAAFWTCYTPMRQNRTMPSLCSALTLQIKQSLCQYYQQSEHQVSVNLRLTLYTHRPSAIIVL